MNTRLRQVREELGLSRKEISEQLGIPSGTYEKYEYGTRNIPSSFVSLLCEKQCVNEEWLRNGTGEMFQETTKEDTIAKLVADLWTGDDDEMMEMIGLLKDVSEEDRKFIYQLTKRLAKK